MLGEALLPRLLAEALRKLFAAWQDDSRYFFSDRESCLALLRETFDRYVAGAAGMYGGASVLVMKDPLLSRELAPLRALRDQGQFVGIVRDPRDVVCSYAEVERRKGEVVGEGTYQALTEKVMGQWPPLYRLLTDSSPDLTLVRYEDLVMDFEGTKRVLEERLGCRLRAERDSIWANVQFDYLAGSKTRQRFFASPDWGKALTDRSIGVYRQHLPKDCVCTIQRVCGDLLGKLGYQAE